MELKKLPRRKKVLLLRELRVRPVRAPQVVSVCAAELIHEKGSSDLGDEKWPVAEQGLVACLECGDQNGAMRFYKLLQEKFGKTSVRLRKLGGLIHESTGNLEKAKRVYEGILMDSPGDTFVAKRFSAMERSAGNIQGAIDALERVPIYADMGVAEGQAPELFSYMQLHRGTEDGVYRELLYLNYLVHRYERAAYYAEECILLDPSCYLNFVRHAELLFIVGNYERSATAYAHSIRLNDKENSARAVYGLWQCTLELLKRSESASKKTDDSGVNGVQLADVRTLHNFAVSKLKALYTGSSQAPRLALQLQRYH